MKRHIKIIMITGLFFTALLISCSPKAETGTKPSAVPSSNKLYMDIHKNIDGLTAEAVAGAHQKDLEVQGEYNVNYLKYWYDENSGTVFCLVSAPSEEAAAKVHEKAHGLVADEIIAVAEGH